MKHHWTLNFLHRLRVNTRDRRRQLASIAGASPITPIFVISCNRVTALQRSLDSYRLSLRSNYEVVIHDNASTYAPLLALLDRMTNEGVTVYRHASPATDADHLNCVANTVESWFGNNSDKPLSGFYVVTDPDVALHTPSAKSLRHGCDILQFCSYLLDKFPSIDVAGPMLRIDDLPDHYPHKQSVLNIHHKNFWSKEPTPLKWRGISTAYQRAPIDTTFGVYRKGFRFKRLCQGVRVYAPFSARHLDWYIDPANLTDDQLYYMQHASRVSNWSGTKFPRRARA